jgi:hypothetical protein
MATARPGCSSAVAAVTMGPDLGLIWAWLSLIWA